MKERIEAIPEDEKVEIKPEFIALFSKKKDLLFLSCHFNRQ